MFKLIRNFVKISFIVSFKGNQSKVLNTQCMHIFTDYCLKSFFMYLKYLDKL